MMIHFFMLDGVNKVPLIHCQRNKMNKHYRRVNKVCLLSVLTLIVGMGQMTFSAHASDAIRMETHEKPFAVKLNATRVVYDPDSKGATLTVSNIQDYPMLVQSSVQGEDTKSKAPFIVTPPLFRLDGMQQNQLRIVRTGGQFATDRESLEWLCVKGIPPEKDAEWAKDKKGNAPTKGVHLNVNVSVGTCVKLLVRPSSVAGNIVDAPSKITWQRKGNKIKATNPTGFYMSLSSVKVGGKPVKNTQYIAPFSSRTYELPAGAGSDVSWTVVTDAGGGSNVFHGQVK